MENKKMQPIGIKLVKSGLVTEGDINRALNYQKSHPQKKLGDILFILNACDSQQLIQLIGEVLDEKAILLKQSDIKINPIEYVALDIMKKYKAIPYDIIAGKLRVCFADTTNKRGIETIRALLMNKGLIMEKVITFETILDNTLELLEGKSSESIATSRDITGLINSIIRTAIDKRASDIHIEPMEKQIRVRYRIDGYLTTVANLENDKQAQIIGRLKAISNMHQEKQDSQDGRIIMYPDYNIRVSSQKNVNGEKFVLRLLKKNIDVKNIFELGFPKDETLVNKAFNKRNSVTILAAPTGEGKTTSLYSIIDYLDRPEFNITTIEDPVEIRMAGLNQIEVDGVKTTFSSSLRNVLRQDPDIILVGEIRDNETAEIAMQAGQTGHYVLSTIHTIDSVEVITRLRKMGISDYDISSTLATSVSQRLVRKVCPHCRMKRDFNEEEKRIIHEVEEKYNVKFDLKGKTTYTAVGCEKCNNTGYYDRIGIFEILLVNDKVEELISKGASSFEIRKVALSQGYKPVVVDGIKKVLDGVTTLDEINNKLALY